MSLSGDLKSLSLWEVFETLSFGRRSGRLELTNGSKKTEIYFEDGMITHIKAQNCEDEDAILGLNFWGDGYFAFYPDEKSPSNKLNLDPLHILVDVSKDIDLVEYLEDLIFLFVDTKNLTDEEKEIGSLFDGLGKTKDIILNSPYGESRTLRAITKLREEEKLLRIDENLNLFWAYTFWRYFLSTLEREEERSFRKKWGEFLKDFSTYYVSLFEALTKERKVVWYDIYPFVRDISQEEFFEIIKKVFSFLENYGKLGVNNVIDTAKIMFLDQELSPLMDKIFVSVNYSENIEENIVLWFFDGERSLSEIKEILPFGELRSLQIIKSLLDKKLILALGDNAKLDILNSFFIFWQRMLNRFEKEGLEDEFRKEWDNFIKNSTSEVKHFFSHLTFEKRQNFPYFYRNIAKYYEGDLRDFVKEAVENITEIGKKYSEDRKLEEYVKQVLEELNS